MIGLGVAVAAVTGYLCIAWLLQVISRIGLAPVRDLPLRDRSADLLAVRLIRPRP